MRRILALLLVTPLLANCSPDSTPPLAASGAVHSEGEAPAAEESWPAEENWFTPEDVLTNSEDEMSAQDVGASAAPAPGAVMMFGDADAGSPYPNSHDGSWHANDRIKPGTVAIDAGETVTFNIAPGHRLALYNDGVQPKDIPATSSPFVLYPVGRLFLQPAPTAQIKLTFTKPGKYLVLCAISRHFYEAQMWGWVHVR